MFNSGQAAQTPSSRSAARRHGLAKLLTVQHRNIEEQGFPEELHGTADALFLDLPGPWKVGAEPVTCTLPAPHIACTPAPGMTHKHLFLLAHLA